MAFTVGQWTLLPLVILAAISSLFNLLVLIKLLRMKNLGGSENSKLLSKAERRLCFYSFTFVLAFIFAQVTNLVLEQDDPFKDFTHLQFALPGYGMDLDLAFRRTTLNAVCQNILRLQTTKCNGRQYQIDTVVANFSWLMVPQEMAEQDFPMMINYKTLVKNYIMAMLILPTFGVVFVILRQFFRKPRDFKTPFARICLCTVIADMVCFVADFFAWDFASCGIVPIYLYIDQGFFPHFFTFIQNFSRDFQFFCAAVIAFNRYTALYWHFAKVEAFWNRATLPFIISGLMISIAMALTQAVPENFYLRVGMYTWFLYAGETYFWGIKLGIWTLIYLLILTGISFIFNLLVLIKLVLIKNRGGAESGKLLSQAEKKLCFVSLYSFTFVLTFIFAQIMNLVLDEADSFKDFTHFLTPLSSNLLSLATVWIWIWHSAELRSLLKDKIAGEPKSPHQATISVRSVHL